jgi:hypothetical protein
LAAAGLRHWLSKSGYFMSAAIAGTANAISIAAIAPMRLRQGMAGLISAIA